MSCIDYPSREIFFVSGKNNSSITDAITRGSLIFQFSLAAMG